MKKLIIALTALLTFAVADANAMSYEQARQQALFLTDKMAYELNLTEQQYEAAYEINLDYLISVNSQADLYGVYWEHRNLDLSYILLDWQYRAFVEATYFYRPLYWSAGYWHFGIYARYPHRSYFYFGRPHFYAVYRGGHSWRHNGGRSWYHGRDWGHRHYSSDRGMRNGFDRGDYGRGNRNMEGNHNGYNQQNNGNRSFGSMPQRSIQNNSNGASFGNGGVQNSNRNDGVYNAGERFGSTKSSTRTTATRPSTSSGSNSSGAFGSSSRAGNTSSPRNTFTPSGSSSSSRWQSAGSSRSVSSGSTSFGNTSRSMGSSTRSMGSSSSRSIGSSSSRSIGSSSLHSMGSSSHASSSFGSASRGGGSSVGGGSRSAGSSRSNGNSFGGRR